MFSLQGYRKGDRVSVEWHGAEWMLMVEMGWVTVTVDGSSALMEKVR
jgi:hypothetical protein